MDTDVLAGIQSGLETILVLSGVTSRSQIQEYSFQPKYIYESVVEIEP
jgi:NagD protein